MLDIAKEETSTVKTSDDTNKLIFGKNDTERIVNVTIDEEGAHIYKNDGTKELIKYQPWALSERAYNRSERLKGNQYYKYITPISIDRYNEMKEEWDRGKWIPRSLEEGFMIREGYTYFKGLKVSDVSLMSFDIEAKSLDPEDENAGVILISTTFRDRKGKMTKKVFNIKDYIKASNPEAILIGMFSKYVKDIDPDILIGHNILGYDLPYLVKRAGNMYVGRDGSGIQFDKKISKKRKDSSQSYDYYNAHIHGREIVDTMFLSLSYDIGRNFPSYGLKAIEKHLNLVDENRIEWDFEKYPPRSYEKWSDEVWNDFIKYCADDADSPIQMFDIMIPPFFYLNQSIPKTLQQIVNEASGSQLDALMIRSYLQDGYSQPKTSAKVQYKGAISMGVPGIYQNVRKVDVASLYPSIMLQYDIYDEEKDPNRNVLKVLEYFREERLKNKALGAKGSDYHQNLSDAQKIVINSMYGFMGAGYLLYNYPQGAADVTRYGREILQTGVKWATGANLVEEVKKVTNKGKDNEETKYHWVLGESNDTGKGFTLVNVDTDSFSYAGSAGDFEDEIRELNTLYDELIKWEDDGTYDQVIVIRAKNYVLRMGNKIKYKGSALTDQKKEPMLRRFLTEVIDCLLDNNMDAVNDLYFKHCLQAMNPSDIRDWTVKKTITKPVLNPERLNEQKIKDAYVEAIEAGIIEGIQEGDKIWVYQAIAGEEQVFSKGEPQFYKDGTPKMKAKTVLRYPQLYNNDHDQFHYVERVWKTLEILENVLPLKNFKKFHLKSNRKYLTKG